MDQNKKMALKEIVSAIDNYRVKDELFDAAYEYITPYKRSIIKKSISLNYKYLSHNFHNSFNQRVVEFECDDFYLKNKVQKKEAAFVFLSKETDSPAQVISLVLLPKIFGIETYVLGLYEKWPEELLLSMELMGIFDVYTISKDLFYKIAKKSISSVAYIFLGDIDKVPYNALHLLPQNKGLIIRDLLADKKIDKEQLSILHPSMELKEVVLEENSPEFSDFSVIYTEKNIIPSNSLLKYSPLILGPGLEGLWVWHNLTPEPFFIKHLICF